MAVSRTFTSVLVAVLVLSSSTLIRAFLFKKVRRLEWISSSTHSKQNKKTAYRNGQLLVVEHLIDCVENPIFGDISSSSSELCLQPSGVNIFGDIGSLLGQAFNIGFILLAARLINRGYLDNLNVDIDKENMGNVDDVDFASGENYKNSMKCPQCYGTGKFEWGDSSSVCALCNGVGSIKTTKKSQQNYLLPGAVDSETDPF